MVGGPTELGYIQSQKSFTLPKSPVVSTIAEFLHGPERPQAIVAMNDLHALLVLEAAQQVGMRIPDDLALVGFDDLDFAATLNPSLTTVAQQPFQLGVEAARLLLARIRGGIGAVSQVRLPTQLVIRSSSINPHHRALSYPYGSSPTVPPEGDDKPSVST
jgi:DNA-binding LacI/PurR family transcriptional regulator